MFNSRKFFIVLILCCLSFCNKVLAGDFITIADTGILRLSPDQKWERSYHTSSGEFKIRFRKLRLGSDSKRFHLIVWMNNNRIADGYCPEVKYGYRIKIFKDRALNRIYVDLENRKRAVLIGYDDQIKKVQKYADSKNYYSPVSAPNIVVDEGGDLRLRFVEGGVDYCPQYKLFWDPRANWFGFEDVTVARPNYEEEAEDEQTDYGAVQVASDELEYEEVFHEGS